MMQVAKDRENRKLNNTTCFGVLESGEVTG